MKRWLIADDLTLGGADPVQPGGGDGSLASAAPTGAPAPTPLQVPLGGAGRRRHLTSPAGVK